MFPRQFDRSLHIVRNPLIGMEIIIDILLCFLDTDSDIL